MIALILAGLLNGAGPESRTLAEQMVEGTGTVADGTEGLRQQHPRQPRENIKDQWAFKRSLEMWPSPL